MSTVITLQPGESVTINAVTEGTPPTDPTIPADAVNLGDLHFDGSQINSEGMTGNKIAYGKIVVPNPLPPGWTGHQTYVSIFESGSGTYAKRMYLAHQPCDYSAVYPAYSEGNGSANIYMSFNIDSDYAVNIKAGEVWYVTIKNELSNGAPSCPPGGNGNFGLRMYPPSF